MLHGSFSTKDERLQAEKFLEFIFDQAPGKVGGLDGGYAFFEAKWMQVKSQREDEQARDDDLESQMTICDWICNST